MENRKKIGIKYCGGCNPTYERREVVERIRSRLSDKFLFIGHDSLQGWDALMLVNGCFRSCATEGLNDKGVPHRSMVEENDFESLLDWLTRLNEK